MVNYPSIITSFPQPTPSSRLNNPSHSGLENLQSSTIGQVEAVIGLSGDGPGTIIGDLRSPSSNGGGHVQSANTGGTGQISYTKGDLIVATSTSVLSKFAIGPDNTILSANSSTASGFQYIAKGIIAQSTVNSIAGQGVSTEQSIMSVTIPASTLGTSRVIRATIYINAFAPSTSVLLRANYGNLAISSILFNSSGNESLDTNMPSNNPTGEIKLTILAKGSTQLQQGMMLVELNKTGRLSNVQGGSVITGYFAMPFSSVATDSNQNQILGLTSKFVTADNNNGINYVGYLVEGIT